MVKLIEHSAEVLPRPHPENPIAVLEFLERIGRTAYQSFDKYVPTTPCGCDNTRGCDQCESTGLLGSASKFCRMILKLGHLSVFEHFWCYAEEQEFDSKGFERIAMAMTEYPYFRFFKPSRTSSRNVCPELGETLTIGASLKTWLQFDETFAPENHLSWLDQAIRQAPALFHPSFSFFPEPGGYPTEIPLALKTCTVRFVTNRGVSHQLVRHRPPAYLQESTRYCNYASSKFQNEISVIRPDLEGERYQTWIDAVTDAEFFYLRLREQGVSAEHARGVLPTDLKTEIVTTATFPQWQYMFDLRYRNKKVHSDIRRIFELAKPLIEQEFQAEV